MVSRTVTIDNGTPTDPGPTQPLVQLFANPASVNSINNYTTNLTWNSNNADYCTSSDFTVPNDPKSPFVTSGLRLGTPAVTTRGFGEGEIRRLSGWIADILDSVHDEAVISSVRRQVLELCHEFPVYR